MARVQRFEDLEVWKLAREITNEVYRLSSVEPFFRDFGLRNQMRDSSVSIMSNIAEGFERDGDKEFVQFLSISKGSAGELRSQLYVALDQAYIVEDDFRRVYGKVVECSPAISGLIKYLRQSELKGRKFT